MRWPKNVLRNEEARRHGAAACFVAWLGLNIFSGNWEYVGFPIALDRVAFAAAAILWLVDVRWRSSRRRVPVAATPPMILIVIIAYVSAVAHGTLTSAFSIFTILDGLAIPFVAYVLARDLFFEERTRRWLLTLLVVLGGYLGLTAIFEVIGPASLVFPRFITNPSIGIHEGRARGPFLSAAPEGTVLTFCGAAAVVAALTWTGVMRIGARLVVAVCAGGVLLTLTRSVWLGALAGGLVALCSAPGTRRWVPKAIVVGAIGVTIAFIAVPGLWSRVSERAAEERPIWDRNNTNAAAVRAVMDHPLVGLGWNRFLATSDRYLVQSPSYPLTGSGVAVHNIYLSRAAELGLPAGALYAFIVVSPYSAILRANVRTVTVDVEWCGIFLAGGTCWLVSTLLTPGLQSLPTVLYFSLAGLILSPYRDVRMAEIEGPGRLTTGTVVDPQPTDLGLSAPQSLEGGTTGLAGSH